jgi:hypothetical protein
MYLVHDQPIVLYGHIVMRKRLLDRGQNPSWRRGEIIGAGLRWSGSPKSEALGDILHQTI